ncbi:hypothetical protein [Granulicella arctica]|uniref:hypothetical protein n=1 Tax=Granulicella arctica TaxID=940613 RepID=UPI0021E042C2|nr:hypothetical protein [Granulicella arctica]
MSKLRLRIYDGTRQPFAAPAKFLVTITDGNFTQQVRDFFPNNDTTFDLPFYDNFGDNYTVVVYADGYKQAGYTPVKLSNSYLTTLDIMLISNNPGFSFVNARFSAASAAYPYIAAGADNATGEARYDALVEQEKPLASLLNLGEAMSQINLSQGTPLDYIKQVRWDAPYAPAQDRFFGWCDVALIDQVKIAAAAGKFAVENNPGLFHPGSTSSWKQIQFGEANVQLTFHENDKLVIDGVNCVMVEPDIDYYKDLGAHAIYEVIPNALTHSLTDPTEVYVLRWIAGQTAGIPQFAPLYMIT